MTPGQYHLARKREGEREEGRRVVGEGKGGRGGRKMERVYIHVIKINEPQLPWL